MYIEGLCFHILFRGSKKITKMWNIYLIYTKHQLCLTLDGFIQEEIYYYLFGKLFTVRYCKYTAKEMTRRNDQKASLELLETISKLSLGLYTQYRH